MSSAGSDPTPVPSPATFEAAWPELAPGPHVRALLFDCDGTLVDTMGLYQRAWARQLAPHGFEVTQDWFYRHAAQSGVGFVRAAVPGMSEATALALEAEVVAELHTRLHELETYDHVVDIARAYHGWLPLVVVSGGSREAVEATLHAVEIRHLFDDVITFDDVGRGKPAPDGYLLALQRLGLDPGSALAYEDSPFGIAAAEAAGIPVIDVRTTPQPDHTDSARPRP